MEKDKATKPERLARLQEELNELKSTLPEHCYGTEGYISVHRATPAHWQKVEELEEEISKLQKELGL
jgi:hypothetical protein